MVVLSRLADGPYAEAKAGGVTLLAFGVLGFLCLCVWAAYQAWTFRAEMIKRFQDAPAEVPLWSSQGLSHRVPQQT